MDIACAVQRVPPGKEKLLPFDAAELHVGQLADQQDVEGDHQAEDGEEDAGHHQSEDKRALAFVADELVGRERDEVGAKRLAPFGWQAGAVDGAEPAPLDEILDPTQLVGAVVVARVIEGVRREVNPPQR